MTRVYIIETPYHLLICATKTILEKRIGKDIILLYKQNFSSTTIKRLKTIFKEVLCFNLIENFIGLLNLKLRQKKIPLLPFFIRQNHNINENWLKNKDVFIFNDNDYYGCFLNFMKKEYNLIEDGLNCYSSDLAAYVRKHRHKLYQLLGFSWGSFGESKFTKTIEVNDISKMRIKYPNSIEMSRDQLFKSLSDNDVDIIAYAFNYQPLLFSPKGDYSLLLTQPLSEDGYVSHSKKIEIYLYLAEKYAVGTLYVKAHPREKEDYSKILPNAVILNNNKIPFELYQLKEKFHFKRAISTFTTAMDSIFCADEKIQMGVEWTRNF